MPSFTDQLGRTISLPSLPRRIISLVPSQTELLYTLGLEEEVAGITKFCVHPTAWFRNKPRVGGTKDIHYEAVRALRPDLILANKEENDREQIEELARHYPLWISDISTLDDALRMIGSVGALTGKQQQAAALSEEIDRRFVAIGKPGPVPTTAPRTAYFIWRKPWMAAGGDTFISDMMERCGLTNLFRTSTRYPAVELHELAAAGCEVLLLSSEPFPFKERHIAEIRETLPGAHIELVDGELFSWYGSRLLEAPAYFRQLREKIQASCYPAPR